MFESKDGYPSNLDELHTCWNTWNEIHTMHGVEERFGQWMINNYGKPDMEWPELFDSSDPWRAYTMLSDQFK